MNSNELRKTGLKTTLPRLKVLEVIRASESRHLSADDVYQLLVEQGFDVGLATVYRVLSQLEMVGILSRNIFDSGKAIFELNEGGHHDHLICLTCGRVDEFQDEVIESRKQKVATINGYQVTMHRLSLYGICPHCSAVPIKVATA